MSKGAITPAALLDYSEAAQYLSTTERHLRELRARRELTCVKVGGLIRFRRIDLDQYIADHVQLARLS